MEVCRVPSGLLEGGLQALLVEAAGVEPASSEGFHKIFYTLS
jgi:hypothetical protein